MLGIGQDLTFTITDNDAVDGFTFAATQPGTAEPVPWDPCDDIEDATGLGFRYAGTTDDRDFRDRAGMVELAHGVGLGHEDDSGELVYPETTTRTELGPGDPNGLDLLGQGPCR
jgi:hypothetical protein